MGQASKAHLAGPTTVGDTPQEFHDIVWVRLVIRKRVGVICKGKPLPSAWQVIESSFGVGLW